MEARMDMSMGTGTFQVPNMRLARIYWYIVAGVVGLFLLCRCVNYLQNSKRLRLRASTSHQSPTKPSNSFFQTWAILTAIIRETSYPQLYISARYFTWLTPPPIGRLIVLFVYWAIIIGFATGGSIIHDVNFWERIGFRNSWVTITQLPLLYLLAGKSSIVGLLTGSSHERLNWLHRWIGRTMFVTASVHGWHFYTEYARAGMASSFFAIMTMGRYGVAAWALLLWSFVLGFAPLRHSCYEFFVLQHILTAILFLWAVHVHAPSYAQYNIWFGVAVWAFDRAVRLVLFFWNNVHVRASLSYCKKTQHFGHQAQIRAVGDDITVVTIKNVHFRWRAGQHIYLWMPTLGPLEQHPYTIACAHQLPETCVCNSIQLVVRKHNGFSKRLHNHAQKLQPANQNKTFTVFVNGPFGAPPHWDVYETLILISASTGASFTLPILESIIQSRKPICTKRVDFLLAARKGEEIDYYVQRLHELITAAGETGIELSVHIAVTGDNQAKYTSLPGEAERERASSTSSTSSTAVGKALLLSEKAVIQEQGESSRARHQRQDSVASTDSHIQKSTSRPDIATFIRGPVEATGGETSVVVCGGKSLVARTRNCVMQLSDERAVHKGTGAQGIHLHAEEYDF